MATTKYLLLLCVIIGIASCYILRAPIRIQRSGLGAIQRPIYRPLRHSLYPRLRPLGQTVGLPFALRRRLPYQNLENLNIDNNNNDDRNNGNRLRQIGGSGRIVRISRPGLAPPRIIYPPGVRRLQSRRIISSRRITPFSRQLSTRISRPSLRTLATGRQLRKVPDRRSKDKVLALFAVDNPRTKQLRTSRRRVTGSTSKLRQRPIVKPQGLTSLPVASEVVAKSTSIQRIGLKKTPTKSLKPIVGGIVSKSKTAGNQIKSSKVIKQESKAIKHTEAKIVDGKIVAQKPIIVADAISSKEAKSKSAVKQDLKISDADTVNINTGVVGNAVEKVQQGTVKDIAIIPAEKSTSYATNTLAHAPKKITAIKSVEQVKGGIIAKKETKLSKEITPIKMVEKAKGSTITETKLSKKVAPSKAVEKSQVSTIAKKETVVKDSAVVIPDTKGQADTSVKSSIKVNDADTVNINAAAITSLGEVTGDTKTGSSKKVVVPDAVVVDKKSVAITDTVSTDIKKVAVAETVALDKKKVVVGGTKVKPVKGITVH